MDMDIDVCNDMRIIKYRSLINDINYALEGKNTLIDSFKEIAATASSSNLEDPDEKNLLFSNPSLALIYDYHKLNDFGKVIMEDSRLFESSKNNAYKKAWMQKYSDIGKLEDIQNKIEASKELVRYCRMKANRKEGFKFIFWALMVLTVDDTDKDEHLSLICDFARMLKIDTDKVMDITQVIKAIYDEEEQLTFRTKVIPWNFSKVLKLYE